MDPKSLESRDFVNFYDAPGWSPWKSGQARTSDAFDKTNNQKSNEAIDNINKSYIGQTKGIVINTKCDVRREEFHPRVEEL